MSWLSKAVRGVGKAVKSERKAAGLPPLTIKSALNAAAGVIPGGNAVKNALASIRGRNVGDVIEENIAAAGERAAGKVAMAKTANDVAGFATSPMGLLIIGAVAFTMLGSRRR